MSEIEILIRPDVSVEFRTDIDDTDAPNGYYQYCVGVILKLRGGKKYRRKIGYRATVIDNHELVLNFAN